MNVDANYFPEEGTAPRIAVDHLHAHPGVEISSADLAVLMRVEIKNVSGTLARAVDAGLIVKRRDGRACFYGVIGARQPASHDAIARMAVIKLRNTMLSSVTLADLCHTSPDVIDAALAPLVAAHKLTRIDVLRSGVPMFDYRYSAAWVPSDADFKFTAPGTAPHPAVSPVAPPAPKRIAPAPAPKPALAPRPAPVAPPVNPASPWYKLGNRDQKPADMTAATPAAEPYDALAAGAELGRKMGVPAEKLEDAAAALGWQLNQVNGLDDATLDAARSTDTLPNILEADDLVMAINSRGEFVIDLGNGGGLIKFPPAQALCLKRFLDNTSVLEELASQGAV